MVRVTWVTTTLGELHQELERGPKLDELVDALRKLGFEPTVANLPVA